MINKTIISIALLITLLLSGCSLYGTRVEGTMVEIPDAYLLTLDEGRATELAGGWWEAFGDEHLDDLVKRTINKNLDISIALERLEQLRSISITSRSFMLPSVNAEGSAGRSRQPGLTGPIETNSYSLSVSASYELDLWGRVRKGAKAAEYDVFATGEDVKSVLVNIVAQAVDLYYLAVEQNKQVELSEKTITSFKDTLEMVERRYRAGLVPAIDVYQSRQNLMSVKAQKPALEAQLQITLNAISVLAGEFPGSRDIKYMGDLPYIPPFSTGLTSELLKNRPDVRASFARLNASDKRIGEALAKRFPSFNLIGSYGGASDEVSTILDSPNIIWNAMLQLAMPLFDAGRRRAEVARTESVFRENLALYHKAVINSFRDVNDSIVRNKASEESIKHYQERVDATDASLKLSLDRYTQGLSDYIPVLTAQGLHFEAQSGLLAARRQLVSDRISMARAIGGSWADEELEKRFNKLNKEEDLP
ncbi:MAG: efflux transporter outer membrane subunit [Nitrospirota bacterium]|nr:MAG: efflux transporter outer membrane subunit [Nitrospirota bacterium]